MQVALIHQACADYQRLAVLWLIGLRLREPAYLDWSGGVADRKMDPAFVSPKVVVLLLIGGSLC